MTKVMTLTNILESIKVMLRQLMTEAADPY